MGKPNIEKMKAKNNVEGLIKALENDLKDDKDEYKQVAVQATRALGEIGDARAVQPLIQAMKNGWLVSEAQWSLEKIGEPAVEPLILSLKDEDILAWSAQVLGKIGDARAVEPLIRILREEHECGRSLVAEALGEICDARAIEPLTQALEDEYVEVREKAASALAKIINAQASPKKIEKLNLPP